MNLAYAYFSILRRYQQIIVMNFVFKNCFLSPSDPDPQAARSQKAHFIRHLGYHHYISNAQFVL